MLNRFLGTSALLAAGWLTVAAACAQTPAPDSNWPPTPYPLLTYHVAQTPAKLLLVPYQVTELVIPVDGSDKAKPATREADLIRTIQDTIAPKSWASHGGRGTIDYFPMTMTLLVNQTPDVQEMIADLLGKMVREQDTQVVLEVRLVSIAEGFAHRGRF